MMVLVRLVLAGAGVAVVYLTLRSAVETLVLPRGAGDPVARAVFRGVSKAFSLRLRRTRMYNDQDRLLAMFAPTGMVSLLAAWLVLAWFGFALLFLALGTASVDHALRLSGSALFTLGFVTPDTGPQTFLAFVEAFVGLLLLALLIAYLPTMYAAFARREVAVNLLAVRAGTPPSAVELLLRAHRIGLGSLAPLWSEWERWFAELEESHVSLSALVFFRSPHPRHSWITSAGAVLDAAALAHSTIEGGREASAALCLRAGYLALRNIAAYFRVGLPFDPHYPEVDIAVTREDYDIACELLAQAGIALRADRDQAWLDFAGWRVNYDLPLLALSALTVAPEAPWSSDRDAEMLPPYAVARAPLRRDE